jgi:subtilisin family serine protease
MVANRNCARWNLIKVHRSITTHDTLALSTNGQVVPLPDFYNTFVLRVPHGYTTIEGVPALRDTLMSISLKQYIRYAELNMIVTLAVDCEPEDTEYELLQGNLHPTDNYPSGHINIIPAWCKSVGISDVKVAIIDSGIRWSHEDFGGPEFANTVIEPGIDMGTGSPLSLDNANDINGHGTKVAGIIGAIRDNFKGIAGIAGGAGSNNGVRIVPIKATYPIDFPATYSDYSELLGAFSFSITNGVNIINCSLGYHQSGDNEYSFDLRELVRTANRLGIVICGARGNYNPVFLSLNYWPAMIQDEWTISVGGSNTIGEYNSNSWSVGVDVVAPSTEQLCKTTAHDNDTDYTSFSQTSAATAHVSGLAALMLSYYSMTNPDNISQVQLVQEDVEYISKATATDIIAEPANFGPDIHTGYGRINAGNALELIKLPECSVFHFSSNEFTSSVSSELIEENIQIYLREPYTNEEGLSFDIGYYTAQVYKASVEIDPNLAANQQFSHSWELHSFSNLMLPLGIAFMGSPYSLLPVPHVEIMGNPSNNSVILEGYIYHLNDGLGTNGYLTVPPTAAVAAFSGILCNTSSTAENVEIGIKVSPNPGSDFAVLDINNAVTVQKMEAYDILGRSWPVSYYEATDQRGKFVLNTSALPSGLIFFKVSSSRACYGVKWLKF